jgi:ABC-type nitrate/sulfonate/bicarbonate transport system permease component
VKSTTRRLASVAVLLVVWELAVRLQLTPSFILAAPTTIVSEIVKLIGNGQLPTHIQASMTRMLSGYVLALITGALLGALMGWFRWLDDIIDPIVELIRPVSPLAILPLAILWLGIGQASKVFVIWYGCLFPILLNTYTGVRGVPKSSVEAARTLGAKTDEMLRRASCFITACP